MSELEQFKQLKSDLEEQLLTQYGPVLTGEDLSRALGYVSYDAFRQAISRKTVQVPLFRIRNRRGTFALSSDVASWLARQRLNEVINEETGKESDSDTS